MTNSEIMDLVKKALPYSNQMTDTELDEEKDFRFSWRGDRFRIGDQLNVEQVDGGFLVGSNIAIIIEELIKAFSQPD